ncbi:zinc-binding dehydrogenase [Rhodococcus opacus]|nr:zinc-binding dehydrogenase [Rhodococcus opacus]
MHRRTTTGARRRNQRLDHRPLLVGQIRRVRIPVDLLTHTGHNDYFSRISHADTPSHFPNTFLGADVVVPRGAGLAERVRAVVPGGVDAVADGANLLDEVTPALRFAGRIAVFRFWDGEPGRGITVHPINVRDRVTDHTAIEALRKQVEAGVLTARVADVFPAAKVVDAHKLFDRGGLRGRVILDFSDDLSS